MQPDQSSFDPSSNNNDSKYKVVLLGNSGVGKTSVLERICRNTFDDRKQQTIGIDFLKKNLVHNKINYRLMLWDTAGQQRYNSLVPNYLRGADCVVLMFDLGNEHSFNDCEKWLEMARNTLGEENNCQCSLVLVANKSDTKQRKLKFETGFEWALKKKVGYVEVSAKTGAGIENLISEVIESTEKKIQSASTVDSQKISEGESSKIERKESVIKGGKLSLSLKKDKNSCCSI